MHDSPSTPITPNSPNDITVHVATIGTDSEKFYSPQVISSGPEVKSNSSSSSVLQGRWRVCKDKNCTPTTIFEPSSCEAAKRFFLTSVKLPPRFPHRQDPLATPKSSRPGFHTMVCHGCHLQMGQGAHQGSAPGRISVYSPTLSFLSWWDG